MIRWSAPPNKVQGYLLRTRTFTLFLPNMPVLGPARLFIEGPASYAIFGRATVQANNRRDQRRSASAEYSICWRDEAGQMRSAVVHSQDLSNSGIRVRGTLELAPGTTIYIECKDNHVQGNCTVRHCTRGAGHGPL